MVAIAGPGGTLVDTTVRPNDAYRGVLLFFSLAESNSGVYTCQVMVDGITVRTATAAMDVAGKLETLHGYTYNKGIGGGGREMLCITCSA